MQGPPHEPGSHRRQKGRNGAPQTQIQNPSRENRTRLQHAPPNEGIEGESRVVQKVPVQIQPAVPVAELQRHRACGDQPHPKRQTHCPDQSPPPCKSPRKKERAGSTGHQRARSRHRPGVAESQRDQSCRAESRGPDHTDGELGGIDG